MANIHTLVASVNKLYLSTDTTNKLHCYDTFDAFARRRSDHKKRKSCNFDYLSGGPARVSGVGHSWRLSAATELPVVQESSSKNINGPNQAPCIEIPVTCYQIIGVHDQAEKDEIVKSVNDLRNAEIEEGYTKDAVNSRQALLMDVMNKLLFEPEYAGNFKDKQPPRSSLKILWAWLPGALCLLQEVGEEKIVLEIGREALQHPESKPFAHDLHLSMALAECAIAKVGFEKNNIAQGFEALFHAQFLLRSKISLAKMMLLSQIEESLKELAPACTLDLLGMPHTPENAERRLGAIGSLRELLRQGLDVEISCQVQDWPCFLNQALKKLMATEIVELVPWDSLALTRKNRKSLESQNQRIVIDFNSFYVVLLAHIALGFSGKQTGLINKAKSICECLIASEGIDLKFEEAFCSFLLGQGDEATAVERLRKLELNSRPSSQNSLQIKETREAPGADKPLETWLKESVLGLFPDTQDCSPSLADFFIGEKRPSGNRQNKRAPPASSTNRHRSIVGALLLDQRDGEPVSSTESSRHLGPAVKQLAPPNLQNYLIEAKAISGSNVGCSPSIQFKRTLGSKQGGAWKFWLGFSHVLGKTMYATALGCILVAVCKVINMQVWRIGKISRWRMGERKIEASSPMWTDSSTDPSYRRATSKQNGIMRKLKKVLSIVKMQSEDCPESADLQTASLSSGFSSPIISTYRQPMPVEDAETLVKRWQAIKAEALGPDHDIHCLFEILEGSMLVQWQALADAAKARSCFWRFVLLQLTVVHADILKDGTGREMAEIEVLLEEAAELVDETQPKNPTYYSPYKIRYLLKRQDDGSWRFCEGDIRTPS
ncbi:plastid division protein CDP1, chloroplastic [Sesamum indicum]|uniref:Plastid division protein CDP1, chloroplastic n=1 Tax=Sesamum indicum TaxID=4182 RepID=A0A6I9SPJ1_SESIN|nr:plastid division protein CDP1, chloroplastic [Sesamum indicum]